MSDAQVFTKPLVPRALWELCKHLENNGVSRHKLFSLFHPKLSIFIDPETIQASFRELVLTQSTDLLLVERPPDAIPRFAFDIHATNSSNLIEQKKLLFESLGIHYQSIKNDQFESITLGLLDRVMADTPDLDKLRGVMNDWQWNAMLVLEQFANAKGLFLLQEVALDSVIAVQDGAMPAQTGDGKIRRRQSPIPWQNKTFLEMTSFDGVVCTQPPNCNPIIALEYDGAHHVTEKQRKKDRKKDSACEAANLPLIRIRSQDLPSSDAMQPQRARIQQRQDSRRLEMKGILRFLVDELSDRQLGSRWYLEQVHHFLTTTANSIKRTLPEVAEDIIGYSEQMLRQAKRSNEDLLLTKSRLKVKELELARIRESGALWIKDEYEREENQFFRAEIFRDEFEPMLEEDFATAVWKNYKGISALEYKSDRDCADGPWYLEVRSSPLLELGGMKLWRRFDGVRTEVTVIADRFNIAEKLKDTGSFIALRERATESLIPEKEKIIRALSEGIRLEPIKEEATKWIARDYKNRENFSSLDEQLKSKIDNLIARASQPKTRDCRVPLEKLDEYLARVEEQCGSEHAEKFRARQTEHRDELAPRDYTTQEVFSHLKSAFQRIKEIVGFLEIDSALKASSLEHAKKRTNSVLEELGLLGKTDIGR